MMSYFEEKTTESERAELYDMYGTQCMEFWLMTHPHPDYKKCSAEPITAPARVDESVPTRRLPPTRPPTKNPSELEAPILRKMPPAAPPSGQQNIVRKSPPRRDPNVFASPPKRIVEKPQAPPRRVPESPALLPETPSASSLPTFYENVSTGGSIPRVKTPPKVELRPVHVQAASKEIQRPKTQAELRMLVKNNTYFADTPTDDEGVYRRAIKRNPKEILLVIGLIVVGVVLACILAYVLFT